MEKKLIPHPTGIIAFMLQKDVEVNMDMSLKNVGLEYGYFTSSWAMYFMTKTNSALVDLYLMHFPVAYTINEDYTTVRKPNGKVSNQN